MAEKYAEVPEDRCGFELRSRVGIPPTSSWEIETSAVCCWRPVWKSHDKTERCIWHTDVDEKPLAELITARADGPERLDGAILRNLPEEREELSFADCSLRGARFNKSKLPNIDFTDADLPKADFTDAYLRWATFTDANLQDADFTDAYLRDANFTGAYLFVANLTNTDLLWADFTDALLTRANFTDALLTRGDFTDADLQKADLSEADARGTNFRHATLQDAVFTRTDCREATFTSTLLYETVFSDTRINSKTTFFDPATTFYDSITSRPGCVYEENSLTILPEDPPSADHLPKDVPPADHLPEDVHPLEAARWVYRRLETLHEENALSEAAREFHISKEEAVLAHVLRCEVGSVRYKATLGV